MPKIAENKSKFSCEYCKKSFARERTLESHACEPRRRWRTKDETRIQIAYDTFKRFYRRCQGPGTKDKTYAEFIKSAYYNAFVSFGNYCVNNNVFAPTRFADFLIKNEIRVDDWPTDALYTKFLIYFIAKEPVSDALTRTIQFAIKYGERNKIKYNDLFRKASLDVLCNEINKGNISPWTLYMSNSGQSFLSILEEYDHKEIWQMINADIWEKRFNDNTGDVEFAKNILTLGGW